MLSPSLPPIHHLHFKNHQNVPRTDVPRTAFGVHLISSKIGWGTPDHPVTSNLINIKES